MVKKIVLTIILFSWIWRTAGAQTAGTERYYQLIEAPTSPDKWEAWRSELRTWKESTLKSLDYTGETYRQPAYKWASNAYSTFFLMANETSLYDDQGNYAIRACLKKYEADYGGVDVVVLWPTYPQLGFDNRTQYSFYRNLPGGVTGLKKLCDDLHQMGKKLLIAYNPWDNMARNQGRTDEDELLAMLRETGSDGVYLDTISNVEGFFQTMQRTNPGAIFQSEIPIRPDVLNQVHQSWLEVGWNDKVKNLEFGEVPVLVRNRWLEQRHMIYRLSRFSHEQSTLLQNAWINGCGVVIWENVFGTVNEVTPRDRSILRAMLPIQRRYTQFFTEGEWLPLFPIQLNRVYASRWQLGKNQLWTLINRQDQWTAGKLFEQKAAEGVRYFDLIAGKELKTRRANGNVSVYAEFGPKAIGCVLAIAESDLTDEFIAFLKKQAATNKRAESSTAFRLPPPILKPVTATQLYAKSNVPTGMVRIPVAPDSVRMTFSFRQRECGFYPIGDFVDYSYSQARNELTMGNITVKLSPYALDETLITNAQFDKFLKASHYQPRHQENFLKHWVNHAPPAGQENHPVVWVALDDARAYARWTGKRLPTEAEWQWAAQNGPAETRYPWGNNFDSTVVNTGQWAGTTPVNRFGKGRTKQGVYDMSGNVWQWTESERTDGHNDFCIVRGGSWYVNRTSEWYADGGAQNTRFGAKYLLTWLGLDRCATVGFSVCCGYGLTKTMKNLYCLLTLCFGFTSGFSQTVTPHPIPEEFGSDYYEVRVNGQPVPVFHAGLNVYFASFDFRGNASVTVSKADKDNYSGQTSNKEAARLDDKGYWRGEVDIRPLSKQIKPQLTGSRVAFSLSEAGQYSVERAGTGQFKDDVIFLFANRPDAHVPSLTAKNVIRLKAGIHNRHIDLKSGQTLYLDAGAVLFGSINVWDAKNVSIRGRGTVVYYGPQSETHDDGWKNQKNWHPLTTHNVQGLTVEGITFVGRSRTWSLQTHTTFDAVFDNIKVLAVNPQNINGDGIDWYGGGRSKVINSLIRSMDDCFAFFTPGSSQDMWATTRNTEGEVTDITIDNCVLWSTLANVFRIGFNGQALTTRNIRMTNTDIIHISKSEWYAPWSLFCMVSPNSKGKANHSNYWFEKIRFEEPTALFGLQNPEAQFQKVTLKDINMIGEPVPSLIKTRTRDVTFDNVLLNGKRVVSEADIPLREGSLRIEHSQASPRK